MQTGREHFQFICKEFDLIMIVRSIILAISCQMQIILKHYSIVHEAYRSFSMSSLPLKHAIVMLHLYWLHIHSSFNLKFNCLKTLYDLCIYTTNKQLNFGRKKLILFFWRLNNAQASNKIQKWWCSSSPFLKFTPCSSALSLHPFSFSNTIQTSI